MKVRLPRGSLLGGCFEVDAGRSAPVEELADLLGAVDGDGSRQQDLALSDIADEDRFGEGERHREVELRGIVVT